MSPRLRAALSLAALLASCGSPASRPPVAAGAGSVDPSKVASAGVSDPAFRALLEDHWEWQLSVSPEWASELGDARYHGAVSDRSLAAGARYEPALRGFLDRANALDETSLTPRDAVFLRLFRDELGAQVASLVCAFGSWSLSPRQNVWGDLQGVTSVQPIGTPAEREAYLTRLRAWSDAIDPHLEALRSGLQAGRVANATSLRLVLELVRGQLSAPTTDWPLYRLPESDPDAFAAALLDVAEEKVRPALTRYADFIERELLPRGRSDDAPGIAALDLGPACYAAQIRAYTTLPLTADELHQRGLDEIARIQAEAVAPGALVFGVWDRQLLFDRLRTEPSLYFEDAEQIVAAASRALEAAEGAVPAAFGRLPKTPCKVSVIPEFEAPYTTIAYYRQPSADGSKPGEYYVNTYAPTTRPRHEAEVLAFHESVPGHHLQIALSYELPAVPAFHRYAGSTAFVEGWGLYSERLADELGLYSGEVDRLGMLSFDLWRAARLVVDTGLHHKGWSRAQAEAFMAEHTPLPLNNIRNEVDRYITWPGQALAYKTGQLEILTLRQEAKDALGERFDLKEFHDTLLGQGAVSLPVLRDQVRGWIEAVKQRR